MINTQFFFALVCSMFFVVITRRHLQLSPTYYFKVFKLKKKNVSLDWFTTLFISLLTSAFVSATLLTNLVFQNVFSRDLQTIIALILFSVEPLIHAFFVMINNNCGRGKLIDVVSSKLIDGIVFLSLFVFLAFYSNSISLGTIIDLQNNSLAGISRWNVLILFPLFLTTYFTFIMSGDRPLKESVQTSFYRGLLNSFRIGNACFAFIIIFFGGITKIDGLSVILSALIEVILFIIKLLIVYFMISYGEKKLRSFGEKTVIRIKLNLLLVHLSTILLYLLGYVLWS